MNEDVIKLKNKVEKSIQQFLEFNELTIEKNDWIELNKDEYLLSLSEATITIDIKNPDNIGLSFNVNCIRENIFHLTNMVSTATENAKISLIESFIFDEEGNFVTGEEAYMLKEKYDLVRAKSILAEANENMISN